MSERFPGGFITKAPVAPTTAAASGIWTLDQALQYIKAGTWPLPKYDPYFNYNTTLIQGSTTNNGTNSTFLDSSTNAFTVTKTGNVSQGSFSPFSQQGWSIYFNGNYLTTPSNAAFGMGTGDFTLETWVYFTAAQAEKHIIDNGTSGGIFLKTQATTVGIGRALVAEDTMFSYSFAQNTWYHIAFCRSGSTVYGFVNGVQIGSATNTINYATGVCYVASASDATKQLNGSLSNLRIVKGTAVYTSAFTVPTTPLTAISGTSLLTCQSNRFVDNSSNAFAITVTGTPSVLPFSPFPASSGYTTSTVGGSAYAVAGSTYLSVAANSQTAPQSSNFTIEAWVYFTNGAANQVQPIYTNYTAFGANSIYFGKHTNTSGTVTVWIGNYSTGGPLLSESTLPPNNAWTHYALVRNGNTFTLYRNGVSTASATYTGAATGSTNPNYITTAGDAPASYTLQGYMSDFRIVNGTAVYTAAFTPPTAPLTAITNTGLLLNCTNSAIYDQTACVDLLTAGNAKASTSVVKYSPASISFDGTNSYVYEQQTTQLYNFGTGDFTIEGWVYPLTQGGHGSSNNDCLFDFRPAAQGVYPCVYLYSSGTGVYYFVSSANQIAGGPIPSNAWTHIALNRTASVTKLYLNGNRTGTVYADTNNYLVSPLMLGQFNDGSGAGWFNGYMDGVRVTKGYGRYPYNFTPPTSSLPSSSGGTAPTASSDPYFKNTTMLLPGNGTNGAQNNTFLDSSSNAFTITRNGNTTQGTFAPFSQTGWSNNFVSGSSTYLSLSGYTPVNFGTGDFTVEAWINLTTMPTSDAWPSNWSNTMVVIESGTPSGGDGFSCIIGATKIFVQNNDTQYGSPLHGLDVGQWNHVAWVRSSGTLYFFVNGNLVGTTSFNVTTGSGSNTYIGCETGQGAYFNGNISNLRVVKGTALYTASFTPSTTPLTAVTNTSLLTCQSNRFIDNSTNAYALTATNGPSVQAFSPFAPTAAWSASTNGGSGYFDGSGDYLTAASNAAFGYGTGDFTIELWMYPTSISGSTPNFFDQRTGNPQVVPTLYLNAGVLSYYVSGANRITGATLVANQWYHIALCRSSGSTKLFLNGVQTGSTYADTNNYITSPVSIFTDGTASGIYQAGYCADLRIVKGTALYTTTFTPPTAPLTAISGTSLLLSATNGGIVDATAKNDLETVGNAQISTTQSKFGGSSMYFDGTNSKAVMRSLPNMNMGSGDFTVECWVYWAGTTTLYQNFVGSNDTFTSNASFFRVWGSGAVGAGSVGIGNPTHDGTSSVYVASALTANTWTHVAATRYNGIIRVFINGVLRATGSSDTSTYDFGQGGTCVGASPWDGANGWYSGYIDDLRITKGIARYTSNFTPPTSAFLTQ